MDSKTNIPDKFKATIEDFMSDINITFPELSNSTQILINKQKQIMKLIPEIRKLS